MYIKTVVSLLEGKKPEYLVSPILRVINICRCPLAKGSLYLEYYNFVSLSFSKA